MKRRNFIKTSILASLFLYVPSILNAKKHRKKTLVLIELNGGIDYLNTVIPYTEKNYYALREDLAIKKENAYILNKSLALNKNLDFLNTLYQNNSLAIINGLGYENPNFSHFRAIEIVETASFSNEYKNKGWLSETLEEYSINKLRPAQAIVFGKRKKGSLFSSNLDILQIKNINDFLKKSSKINLGKDNDNESLNFLFKQKYSIKRANEALNTYLKKDTIMNAIPNSKLAINFSEALKIIDSALEIPVLKLSHQSYDTHANQENTLNTLLKDLDDALKYFVSELKRKDLYKDVLILTYSEFGRRVKQNASFGTDHGTACFSFVLGSVTKGGIYGEYPSLDNLFKNNLIYTTEYKTFYNTILTKWFLEKNNKFNAYNTLNFI